MDLLSAADVLVRRPGYREYPAPAGLRDALACVWVRKVPAWGSAALQVLPDACADLIWQAERGLFVAGPDTEPVVSQVPPGSVLVGARFRPGAGGPALGVPLSELRNLRVDAAELLPGLGRGPLGPGAVPPEAALPAVVDLAARLVTAGPPDRAVRGAVRLLADPRARVEAVADDVGLSERQLRRRFHAAVGYGPRTLQRVLRFNRFLARLDAGRTRRLDLARLAVEAGYADQAHLTREATRLAGLPPAALARARSAVAPAAGAGR